MRAEVLTSPERRRRWSTAEKARILLEADAAGAVVSEVARRHDITRQHIYQWRREFRRRAATSSDLPAFIPVELRDEHELNVLSALHGSAAAGVVELVLRNDRRLRIHGRVEDDVLVRLIRIGEAT